jgi:pimeloyl-ACP methyl ester carboxylesterase
MTRIFRDAASAAQIMALNAQVLAAWPVPNRQIRLPTSQGETFVVACDAADAPPLVLLHGAQSNAASWMFGDAGFSAPSRPPLASDAHARWLDEVVAGLGISRAAFAGLSLGGWLALD